MNILAWLMKTDFDIERERMEQERKLEEASDRLFEYHLQQRKQIQLMKRAEDHRKKTRGRRVSY
jgi:hypothetical protein